MSTPSPSLLYEQTGGGDAYRVAMLEHGYVVPVSPEARRLSPLRSPGKRLQVCGLTHMPKWSEWRDYTDEHGPYLGRWCVVCARVDVRAAPVGVPDTDEGPA